jgi:hypothetical protein
MVREMPYGPTEGLRRIIEFLTESPESQFQYEAQAIAGGLFTPLGMYHHARDNVNYMRDYMRNSDVSWSDIKYPTRTPGYSGYSGYGSTVSYVSKNIMKLYS